MLLLFLSLFVLQMPVIANNLNQALETPNTEKPVQSSELEKNTEKTKPSQLMSSYFPKTSSLDKKNSSLGIRDLMTSFFFLSLIVAFIFFFSWLFKRSGLSPGTGNQVIKILSSVAVGQKEKLTLIEIGEQQILIAISSGNIQKLLTLEKPVQFDEKAIESGSINKFSTEFSSQLLKYFRAKKNDK